MKLWIDTETWNEVPINVGTPKYATTVEVTLFAWAVDDEPAQVWDVTADPTPPLDLTMAVLMADEVWAHQSNFDRTVLRHALPALCPPLEKWRDTMVQAYSHSLPGKLEVLCAVLGVPEDKAKAKRGKQLVQLFCKPRPKNSKVRRATRETHPVEWAEFVDYARLDVEAMRHIHGLMPKWNYPNNTSELALWHLDQKINDRGIAVDLDLAHAALAAVEDEKVVLAEKTVEMTGGELASTTKRDRMLEYVLGTFGVALPDMTAATLERRLEDENIPEPMKDLLRIRLQATSTSTSKYKTLVKATNLDGRLRGLLQFNGAGRTGRWAGRTFQPQNLPRPTLKQSAIDDSIEAIKAGSAGFIYTNVMEVASSAIRGCLMAPEGRILRVSDLSNIEGRALAWLAGEEWKLDAFRAYDNILGYDEKGKAIREGHDLYILAFAKSFGIDPEAVDKDQRQVGKVQELALGYAGGVGAFVTFAMAYNIDLDDLAAAILETASPELVAEARSFWQWLLKQSKPNTFGMSEDTFVACDVVKRGWRQGHAKVVAWWGMLEQAFRDACDSPATTFDCGTVKIRRDGTWLRIRLPSGRFLCYPAPRIDEKGKCSYMGMDQYTRKWSRIHTHGGKLAENVTQAFARDVLASNMPAIDAAGYQIVLTVHDEILSETPDTDDFHHDQLSAFMSTVPPWSPGLPLSSAGFSSHRYKKD